MHGFDWNGNGKHDSFDSFMDMEFTNKTSNPKLKDMKRNDNEYHGKKSYDPQIEEDAEAVLKSLFAAVLCILGVVIPVLLEAGPVATILCIFGCFAVAIAILRNVSNNSN